MEWKTVCGVVAFLCLVLVGLTSTAPQQPEDVPDVPDEDFDAVFGSKQDYENRTSNPEPPLPPPIPPSDGCVCVPFYQCVDGKVNEDGTGLIDIRAEARACLNRFDVCCNVGDVDREIPIPKQTPVEGCGFRNVDGVGFRIIGDEDNEAQFGEFPWTGIVMRREIIDDKTAVNIFQCGCAVIHPSVVITAAHCVNGKRPSILRLRFGEWDTKTLEELYPHQDRGAVKVVVHEEFSSGSLHNDIAVIILDKPVEIAPNVNTLCLPPPGSEFDIPNCLSSGWGKNNFEKRGKYQLIMKKVELGMVPHHACQDALRTTRLGHYFRLHKSFVCAGGEERKDTCTGDGGSPLICPIDGKINRYYHVGIVAWGIGCGMKGVPGVYTNVPLYTTWIEDVMTRNGITDFSHKP